MEIDSVKMTKCCHCKLKKLRVDISIATEEHHVGQQVLQLRDQVDKNQLGLICEKLVNHLTLGLGSIVKNLYQFLQYLYCNCVPSGAAKFLVTQSKQKAATSHSDSHVTGVLCSPKF